VATFTITYSASAQNKEATTEDVEADDYIDQGEWTTFRRFDGIGRVEQVLRVRQHDVKRIDRKNS
jgi:hypothetical protein